MADRAILPAMVADGRGGVLELDEQAPYRLELTRGVVPGTLMVDLVFPGGTATVRVSVDRLRSWLDDLARAELLDVNGAADVEAGRLRSTLKGEPAGGWPAQRLPGE